MSKAKRQSDSARTSEIIVFNEDNIWLAVQNACDPVPDGFRTVIGWAVKWGKCRARTHVILTDLVKQGLMTSQTFRIRLASGMVRSVTHYQVVKG